MWCDVNYEDCCKDGSGEMELQKQMWPENVQEL